MKLYPLSRRARVTIYRLWRAGSALVIAYGFAIPHVELWEQLVIVLLGLGYGGAAHIALKHADPEPGRGEAPRGPEAESAPSARRALETLEQAIRRARR